MGGVTVTETVRMTWVLQAIIAVVAREQDLTESILDQGK